MTRYRWMGMENGIPQEKKIHTPSASSHDVAATHATARVGVAYGLAAYLWWGMQPVYFKLVARVPTTEVLAHRIIWSVVLLAVLMRLFGRWPAAIAALRNRRTLCTLATTTLLIATNWFVFIWAVENSQVLQASLGYFINPLVSVFLGFVFLRERFRPWQTLSIALAAMGVAYLTITLGQLPLIALVLACSFGLYGLLRKTAGVDALVGLTVETTLLLPAALFYLGYLATRHECAFGTESWGLSGLLALSGAVTAVPLLWFANAALRLRLATLGFLQYIAPTGQFLLAVIAFDETFTRTHLLGFTCIWTALLIYSADTALHAPRKRTSLSSNASPARHAGSQAPPPGLQDD